MEYRFSARISSLQPSAIREILKFTADPKVIPFAAGNPSPEAFPAGQIHRIVDDIFNEEPIAALQYSVTEGYPPLRGQIAGMLKARCGVGAPDDGVLVVTGAQQGVDLAARCLLDEGDTVLCESPSFIGSLNCFRSYRCSLVGVDMDADGVNLEKLEAAMKQNPRAKLLYLIPNFQNPTGITMSLAKRRAVYGLAKRHGILILEDNPYGELRFSGEDVPPIKSMDEEGLVVYCGSYSKVLAPGIRVGYLCANQKLLSKFTVAKQCADVHTAILMQMLCYRFFQEVDFDAHVERLRGIYRAKCRRMVDGVDRYFHPAVTHTNPEGGLFLWCTLPEGSDMMGFCTEAVKRCVAVVPGSAFMASEDLPTTSFRMNYTTPSDDRIDEGCKILGELTRELIH